MVCWRKDIVFQSEKRSHWHCIIPATTHFQFLGNGAPLSTQPMSAPTTPAHLDCTLEIVPSNCSPSGVRIQTLLSLRSLPTMGRLGVERQIFTLQICLTSVLMAKAMLDHGSNHGDLVKGTNIANNNSNRYHLWK